MKSRITVILVVASCLIFAGEGIAQSPAALAAESEAYCVSTRKDRPTPPDLIVSKVADACSLLQKEGTRAFSKFKGKGSPYIFDGTYIWIHSMENATMLMHPIKYQMEGNKLIRLKDKNGKRFFVVMNNLIREKDEGWVAYIWPEPGTNKFIRKVSYVKGCRTADGVDVVLGCGVYNGNKEDLDKLDIQ